MDSYRLRIYPNADDELIAPDGTVVAAYDDLQAPDATPTVDMIDDALAGVDAPPEIRAACIAVAQGIATETAGAVPADGGSEMDAYGEAASTGPPDDTGTNESSTPDPNENERENGDGDGDGDERETR